MVTTFERVIDANEIWIGDFRYSMPNPVRRGLASQFPPKVIFGDTDKDSNQRASAVIFSDFRGGLGEFLIDGTEDTNRFFRSHLGTRARGHLTLPELITTTTDPSQAGTMTRMGQLGGDLFVAMGGGNDLFETEDGGSTWNDRANLGANAVDMINIVLGGTEYLVISETSQFEFTSNGTSFSTNGKNVLYFTEWDDRLWGIDAVGQLWYFTRGTLSTTETDAVNSALINLRGDTVTALLTGWNGESPQRRIIYAATETGLWAHDNLNNRFVKSYDFPRKNGAGTWTKEFQGDIFIPAGEGIYIYTPGPTPTIDVMGPDRDEGLPANERGDIVQLEVAHNELIALINGSTNRQILGWNGTAWFHMALNTANDIDTIFVMEDSNSYRLYYGDNARVRHITLHSEVLNPEQISTINYQDGDHVFETPWFDAGQYDIEKLALRLRIEMNNPTSNTIKFEYALDYSTAYESSSITTSVSGLVTGFFSASDSTTLHTSNRTKFREGVIFRAIRFRFTLDQSGVSTNTPDLRSFTLEYRKKIPPEYSFGVDLSIMDGYKGQSALDQRANLRAVIEQNLLTQVTYRDDDTNVRNYFCDITAFSGLEGSGRNEEGPVTLTLVET